MSHYLVSRYDHLIYHTKHSAPLIFPEWEDQLYAYIGGILRKQGNKLLKAGGMPDHIHLLIWTSQHHALKDMIREIKAKSSSFVKAAFQVTNFQWQRGYAAFSTDRTRLDQIARYIANQKEHHRHETSADELRRLEREATVAAERFREYE